MILLMSTVVGHFKGKLRIYQFKCELAKEGKINGKTISWEYWIL